MDNTAAAGAFLGFIGLAFIFILLLSYVPLVFYLLSLQRCFNAVRPEFRPGLPVGLVWLALIPALGVVVLLIAIVLLSTSLKKEDEARGTAHFGDGGLAIGLAAMILAMVSWIPFLGILLGLGSLVCWIMHWVKIAGFRKVLAALGGNASPAVMTPPPIPAAASGMAPPPPPAAVAPPPPPPPPAAQATEEATLHYSSIGNARLVCIVGALQGMTFPVGTGITLGRSQEADLVVPDPQISNRHAWVGVLNHQLTLRDLQSTNGTYLNDNLNAPVQEVVLKEGDVIVLGKHNQMKFKVTLA